MVAALDRAALALIAQLEGYHAGGTCPTCDNALIPPTLTMSEVIKVFDRCEKWLKESAKLRPDDLAEGAGLGMYREFLDRQMAREKQSKFNRLVRDRQPINGVECPPPKQGKPTLAEERQRKKYHQAALAKLAEEEEEDILSNMMNRAHAAKQDDEDEE